ncbi:Gfo/Idh/MocA family oxidoreductase [Paenibacillus sp. UMB4589-SE434]|uniref:Gfo/Idh/MocA family protein n=1 Tax=Paenibacillus sp. UMB4589-SE434 TaxID=3046314 RepID=UPI0025512708|nr:Gfo/Idh/MocA family oxidoreductase [Paenibacillus sp. UMB4589-SE434]MDK8179941.1 Gfo/Idh/MocA family oxidoreductase [Paenibacillus sp. UMB4589-SE434]
MNKRIGIIGLGDIAQKAYLPVLTQLDHVEIVAIMARTDKTVENVGKRYRIDGRYTDVESLLQQGLDAVFIHTPTEVHEQIAIQCLERGIHVYIDKPLSYQIDASKRMMEASAKYNRLLAVGFNRRFAPMYQQAKAWLDEVGGFDLCIAQKHRTKQQKLSAKETLYDDLIHMIDLLLWFGAKPYEIASYIQEADEQNRLLHATGQLTFGHSSALFSMNRRAGADIEKVELHGGGRSVEILNLETAEWSDRLTGQQVKKFGSWNSIGERRGFAGVIQHFLESLDQPERCSIRADQVMESHLLIEKLNLTK